MKTTLSQNASNSDKRHDSDDVNDVDNDDDGDVNVNDSDYGLTQRFFSFSISKFEKN